VGSLFADPPFSLTQRPMSNLSGPDSIVASIVTLNGVRSVGSHVVGPAISLMEPILTSLAVHEGLFSPVFSVRHRFPPDPDWAPAGLAAKPLTRAVSAKIASVLDTGLFSVAAHPRSHLHLQLI
jgi:hypothetical protein